MTDLKAINAAREAFFLAPLSEQHGWYTALEEMARQTRSARGQLIAFGGPADFPLNCITDLRDDHHFVEFEEIKGGDPRVNWRVQCVRPPLEIVSEHHYAEARQHGRFDIYNDFAARYDMRHGCQTVLIQGTNRFFGLATLRTEADGPTTEEDRAIFGSIAPAVQTAIRMQQALEHQGAALVAGALEAMDAAAIILDQRGRVLTMTPAAELLASAQTHIRVHAGALAAIKLRSDTELQKALARGLAARNGAHASLVWLEAARPDLGAQSCEIYALPLREWNFGEQPRLLIAFRRPTEWQTRHRASLQERFGLTVAEAEVAMQAAKGSSREEIAQSRRVTTETVSTQFKQIYRKADVSHSGALVALLRDILG